MNITHIAIWTRNIDTMRDFYTKYFSCISNKKYINESKGFQSYFLDFGKHCKIELMRMNTISELPHDTCSQYFGFSHIAISVGTKDNVNKISDVLRKDGFCIISEPRYTGDGFYESCILDPENNRIEITE